jgi:hypothetical protein
LLDDQVEIRPLPDYPFKFLPGIFKKHWGTMADGLFKERKSYNEIDELNLL